MISSRPHFSNVSSTLNEKPKSTARVKYCSAPSKRCMAASSSVRSTPSASNISGPISFWPPLPRVAVASAVRIPESAIQHHEQPVVLVVGMRRRHA